MQQADDKEEILLKRPWTDEEGKATYFRLKDFDAHLKRNKFFEYKSHKIAQRLRDKGGESLQIRIKGRPVRVWKIPSFDAVEVELSAPEFGGNENKEVF
jgi:hypothetical protein